MYVIKAVPEDFVVKETGSLQPTGSGPHAMFVLHKRNWNTLDALEAIATALNVPLRFFGFAGNKDKQAVTEQVCSAKSVTRDALEKVSLPGILLTYLGQSGRPVSLGTHEGNRFTITVRNLDSMPTVNPRFVNLFGGQRFSTHNVAIGRALVKRQWDVVIDHLSHDPTHATLIRRALAKHPKDTLGALRHIPLRLLTLYVHSYQSSLWNALAQTMASAGAPQQDVPILGFGTTPADIAAFPLITEQLQAEAITPRDFVIRQLPGISAEGGNRPLYAEAHDLVIGPYVDDAHTSGKKSVTMSFTLGKGSYATEFIKQTFGTP